MLRPKSRSDSVDLGQKNHHSSVFSRTLSASKLCRGDALVSQIDGNALKSVDKKPYKVSNLSENQVDRVLAMQQRMGQLEAELQRAKEQLIIAEVERDEALSQCREAQEGANVQESGALVRGKMEELMMELKNLKDLLHNSQQELRMKDAKLEALESELGDVLQFKRVMEERERSIHKLEDELSIMRESEMKAKGLLSQHVNRIHELEAQVKTGKESESEMASSLANESKLLEQAKDELEESKVEINSLRKNIESLEEISKQNLNKSGNIGNVGRHEEDIKNLQSELQQVKESLARAQQSEKEALLKTNSLHDEMELLKIEMEIQGKDLLSENKKRTVELEAEVEREKETESKMVDSLDTRTKELDQTKLELEETRTEIASLRRNIESLEELSKQSNLEDSGDKNNGDPIEEEMKSLKSELQQLKQSLARAEEGEKEASLKTKSLLEEMEILKNEMKLAMEAEEKSNKAMEDLAVALKEVVTEATHTKKKLSDSQMELEHVKGEAEQLKKMVRSTEEKYEKLLQEAKQETNLYRKKSERLRLEAEESLLAWNGKEMGFVSCIKRTEEERATAHHENAKLSESLKAAEHTMRAAKEENYKLRDILKQAVNEANAAKAAAGIARDENSQLKDCLAEKEENLHFLTRENERLRINEAAARENVKEFKKLLSTTSVELKVEDNKELSGMLKSLESMDEKNEQKPVKRTFSFNIEDLKFMNDPEDPTEKVLHEDPEKAEALKGSIFDVNAETPRSEPHTPKPAAPSHQRAYSCTFAEDGVEISEDFGQSDSAHEDSDSEKNANRRRKTMFRRVGDLLMVRRSFYSFHRKEPSTE